MQKFLGHVLRRSAIKVCKLLTYTWYSDNITVKAMLVYLCLYLRSCNAQRNGNPLRTYITAMVQAFDSMNNINSPDIWFTRNAEMSCF